MFPVELIRTRLERALGTCDKDEILDRVNSAAEILCSKALWDPCRGFVDICVGASDTITLPDEVDTILAINIAGRPAMGHDMYWQFHLNGPGIKEQTGNSCNYDWIDGASWPTFTDPQTYFHVVAALYSPQDNNVPFRVYGYDDKGLWITSVENGAAVDGFLVPTTYGVSIPNPAAPLLSRITRVSKGSSQGYIRLSTLDYDATTGAGTILGYYRPNDAEPKYRRVRLSQTCTWARVAFRRKLFLLTQYSDLIPLHSTQAVVLMCQALKKLDADRIDEARKYWNAAVEMLEEKQVSVSPPTGPTMQVSDRNLIADKNDRMD